MEIPSTVPEVWTASTEQNPSGLVYSCRLESRAVCRPLVMLTYALPTAETAVPAIPVCVQAQISELENTICCYCVKKQTERLTGFSLRSHSSHKLAITITNGLNIKIHVACNQSSSQMLTQVLWRCGHYFSSKMTVRRFSMFTFFRGIGVSIFEDPLNEGDNVMHILCDS